MSETSAEFLTGSDGTSAVTQRLRVEVVVDKLLPLDDVLGVIAVIDRARHFLLLFVVHLGVDITTRELSETSETGAFVTEPPTDRDWT